jgi:hypothetical protein
MTDSNVSNDEQVRDSAIKFMAAIDTQRAKDLFRALKLPRNSETEALILKEVQEILDLYRQHDPYAGTCEFSDGLCCARMKFRQGIAHGVCIDVKDRC